VLADLSLFVLRGFFAGGVLQQLGVDLVGGKLNVPDNRTTNEAVLDAEHVRILVRIGDRNVNQLDVQILVYTVKRSTNRQVVLQLLPTKDLKNE